MIDSVNEIDNQNEGGNRINARGFPNQPIENIPQIQSKTAHDIKLQTNNQKKVALPKNQKAEKNDEKYQGKMDAE